jgi:glyoxylase I family protein
VKILGLCFVGSATPRRAEMSEFLSSVFELRQEALDGPGADFFALPDGSHFAVASTPETGETRRSVGFLVDDLDQAIAELAARGVPVDQEPAENLSMRYTHFVAPDGRLYELIEYKPAD